jgi:hypothetical protein
MEMPPGPPSLGATAPPIEPGAETPEVEDEGNRYEAERQRPLADEAANRRLVATTGALALVAVAVMIAAFLLTQDSSEEGPEAGVAVPVTLPTPTTDAPPPDIDQAELDQVVEDVSAFVESERGLEFTGDVELTVLNRTDFEERVRATFDEEAKAFDRSIRQLTALRQALGIWDPVDDPVVLMRQLVTEGSIGFYDPETEEMVIGATELSPLLESTLAHELTHALDDQHFDLERPDLDLVTDESGLAFRAVAEGDASRVQRAYEATFSDDELQAMADESEQLSADADLAGLPPIFAIEQEFVYEGGRSFVQTLFEEGGNRAVNDALREPPTTSEQVMEPETFLSGLPHNRLDAPPSDGEPIASGEVGQLTLGSLASFEEEASTPAPEWNGDSYVLWIPDGTTRVCARVFVTGDVDGYEQRLQPWADAVGAELEPTSDGGLAITACPQ